MTGPQTPETNTLETKTLETNTLETNTLETNTLETNTDHNIEIKDNAQKKLPIFLLANIQSFGNSENTDKTTEIETILGHNSIDVACFTETWLNENTKDQISLNNYVNFHSIR